MTQRQATKRAKPNIESRTVTDSAMARMPSGAVEFRLRSRIHPDDMASKVGKVLSDDDYNVLLTRACRVYKPNGQLLLVYLPKAMPESLADTAYPILTTIRELSKNRGKAGGGEIVRVRKQSYSQPVRSSTVGFIDPMKRMPYCRLTGWTGSNVQRFLGLYPYFQHVAHLFKEHVPDRFAVQQDRADRTLPDWVIEGTPFTTVTVNNTYPTGVHKDAGDLAEGFSCLTTLRRGAYTGGRLTFPEYRVAVDMQDRDVLLMDAHEWHGNTDIIAQDETAERISVVLYYRTNMIDCKTPDEERERAMADGILFINGVEQE